MTECASWHALVCSGEEWAETRGQWGGTTVGRRDKRGSPVEPQAIDMAWVRACRSVGARAAPCIFSNAIKDIFGTVGALAPVEARQRRLATAICVFEPGAFAAPARRNRRASSTRCCAPRRKLDISRARPRLASVPQPMGARRLAAVGSRLAAADCSARHAASW